MASGCTHPGARCTDGSAARDLESLLSGLCGRSDPPSFAAQPLKPSWEPYTLRFEDEGGADSGDRSGCPIIIENYGVHREARIRLGYQSLLLDELGAGLRDIRLLDLSTSGLALSCQGRLPRKGARLDGLVLRGTELEPIHFEAIVRRTQTLGGERRLALEFCRLSREDRRRLARYVFQRHPRFGARRRAGQREPALAW